MSTASLSPLLSRRTAEADSVFSCCNTVVFGGDALIALSHFATMPIGTCRKRLRLSSIFNILKMIDVYQACRLLDCFRHVEYPSEGDRFLEAA